MGIGGDGCVVPCACCVPSRIVTLRGAAGFSNSRWATRRRQSENASPGTGPLVRTQPKLARCRASSFSAQRRSGTWATRRLGCREAIAGADIVYAEDTRRSSKLLEALGVEQTLRSYFAGNEAARSSELAGHLAEGATVVLLTDAGTPSISDPGLSAVHAAVSVGAGVTVVPGPSAVTAALAVSGLPSERFVFEGFLPRKGGVRSTRLAALATEARTVVLFAGKGKVARDLRDLADAWGRPARRWWHESSPSSMRKCGAERSARRPCGGARRSPPRRVHPGHRGRGRTPSLSRTTCSKPSPTSNPRGFAIGGRARSRRPPGGVAA